MQQLMTRENVDRYLKGEMTWAQIAGISIEQAYGMAEIGYHLLTQGKLDAAEKIYKGLIEVNAKDGYFKSVLGAIWAKQGRLEEALSAFSAAIELGYVDAQVYLNRAEIYLKSGHAQEALHDLQSVLKLDRDPLSKVHMRAKALAAATAETIGAF